MNITTVRSPVTINFRPGKLVDGNVIWMDDEDHNFITPRGMKTIASDWVTNLTKYAFLSEGATEFVEECTAIVNTTLKQVIITIGRDMVVGDIGKTIIGPNGTEVLITGIVSTTIVDVNITRNEGSAVGNSIIVNNSTNNLKDTVNAIVSNTYDTQQGASHNKRTIDTSEETITIVNTRSIMFTELNTDRVFKEIGWSNNADEGNDTELCGRQTTSLNYYTGDVPYVRISITRVINFSDIVAGTGDVIQGMSASSASTLLDNGRFDETYYSHIAPDGTTVPPTKSFTLLEPANVNSANVNFVCADNVTNTVEPMFDSIDTLDSLSLPNASNIFVDAEYGIAFENGGVIVNTYTVADDVIVQSGGTSYPDTPLSIFVDTIGKRILTVEAGWVNSYKYDNTGVVTWDAYLVATYTDVKSIASLDANRFAVVGLVQGDTNITFKVYSVANSIITEDLSAVVNGLEKVVYAGGDTTDVFYGYSDADSDGYRNIVHIEVDVGIVVTTNTIEHVGLTNIVATGSPSINPVAYADVGGNLYTITGMGVLTGTPVPSGGSDFGTSFYTDTDYEEVVLGDNGARVAMPSGTPLMSLPPGRPQNIGTGHMIGFANQILTLYGIQRGPLHLVKSTSGIIKKYMGYTPLADGYSYFDMGVLDDGTFITVEGNDNSDMNIIIHAYTVIGNNLTLLDTQTYNDPATTGHMSACVVDTIVVIHMYETTSTIHLVNNVLTIDLQETGVANRADWIVYSPKTNNYVMHIGSSYRICTLSTLAEITIQDIDGNFDYLGVIFGSNSVPLFILDDGVSVVGIYEYNGVGDVLDLIITLPVAIGNLVKVYQDTVCVLGTEKAYHIDAQTQTYVERPYVDIVETNETFLLTTQDGVNNLYDFNANNEKRSYGVIVPQFTLMRNNSVVITDNISGDNIPGMIMPLVSGRVTRTTDIFFDNEDYFTQLRSISVTDNESSTNTPALIPWVINFDSTVSVINKQLRHIKFIASWFRGIGV